MVIRTALIQDVVRAFKFAMRLGCRVTLRAGPAVVTDVETVRGGYLVSFKMVNRRSVTCVFVLDVGRADVEEFVECFAGAELVNFIPSTGADDTRPGSARCSAEISVEAGDFDRFVEYAEDDQMVVDVK